MKNSELKELLPLALSDYQYKAANHDVQMFIAARIDESGVIVSEGPTSHDKEQLIEYCKEHNNKRWPAWGVFRIYENGTIVNKCGVILAKYTPTPSVEGCWIEVVVKDIKHYVKCASLQVAWEGLKYISECWLAQIIYEPEDIQDNREDIRVFSTITELSWFLDRYVS